MNRVDIRTLFCTFFHLQSSNSFRFRLKCLVDLNFSLEIRFALNVSMINGTADEEKPKKKKTSKVLIAIKLCGLAAVKGTLLSELMNKFSISIRRTI